MLSRVRNSRRRPTNAPAAFHLSVPANRRQAASLRAGNRGTPMIGNRICAIALATASATICSTPSAIAASFDGNWSVVAQTTQGHCGSIQFGLAINHGRLYAAGGYYVFGYPAQGGRISPPGMCRRTQWLARAPPMPSDASGSFRAAGLGPVAGRVSGTPLH
jgi:hypothetical protein